jgi:thioesterase domain-containing protein/acyl carrier protein
MTLEALPLTSNGKVDRRRILASDHTVLEFDRDRILPRDLVEFQLSQIWEQLLGIQPVGVRDNFFNLGGHSLLAVRLMAQIESRFGQDLPLSILFQTPTIEDLAFVIRQQVQRPVNSPLVTIQPDGSRRPFFCAHPIGGNVLCFAELARHLGTDQPFYGLQSVTLYEESKNNSCVEEMAARYIDAIRTVQPLGPYSIGGYSFGGYIAYEMARQLRLQSQEVKLLALLDSPAPPNVITQLDECADRDIDDITLLAAFAKWENLSLPLSKLQLVEPEERLNFVLEQINKAQLLPPDTGLSHLRRLLNTYRINLQAMERYRPYIYEGQVTLFRASVPRQTPEQSWGSLAGGGYQVYDVPGNHETMLKEPNVQVLAEQLNSELKRL